MNPVATSRRALVVAKKDFRDAIRSWELWGLVLIFTGLTAGLYYAIHETPFLTFVWPEYLEFFGSANLGVTTVEYVGFYVGIAEAFIPIVALLVSHKAIAGEVESGSVKFLISAPLTRFDAMFGKLVGRTGVLWTALAVGFLLSVGVIQFVAGAFSPVPYGLFIMLTFLFVLSYVSIGVALSALARSTQRAALYVISFFIGVGMMIHFVPYLGLWITEGDPFPNRLPSADVVDAPAWFFFIPRLSPGRAYRAATTAYINEDSFAFEAAFDPLPFYLTDWFTLVILLAWTVLGFAVGYVVFERSDIN